MPTTPDSSGNGFIGTLVGFGPLPTLVASPWSGFDNALDFDPDNGDGVNCGPWDGGGVTAISGLGVAAAFTLEARFQQTDTTIEGSIAGWDQSHDPQLFARYDVVANGFAFFGTDNLGNFIDLEGGSPPDLLPHVVAVDYDGTTLRLYVDGSMVASQLITGIASYNSGDNFWIGNDDAGDALAGIVDEVRWSNVARYASDAGYTPATSPFTTDVNTIALYHLDVTGNVSTQGLPAFGAGYAPVTPTLLLTPCPPAFGAGYAPPIPPTLLTTHAPRASGAGYAVPASAATVLKTLCPSAFGAGYSQILLSIIVADPVVPTGSNAYLLRNRTARATSSLLVPVTPPPPSGSPGPGDPFPISGTGPGDAIAAGIALAPLGIPLVSETYPLPVIIGGQPYADANRDPWTPTVKQGVWATQLQLEINGEDMTFFRGVPTVIQNWASQEPFGDSSMVFQLPAVTSFDQLVQPVAIPTGGSVGIAGTFTGMGYWQVAATGLVTPYGDASFFGDPLGLLNAPISGIASSPRGYGYVLCAEDGGVFANGSIPFVGSMPSENLIPPAPIIAIACTSTGNGYWLLDELGQVYSFGDAQYYGNATPVGGSTAVGIARSPTGNGYYILTSNGAVYSFGDAQYYGGGSSSFVAPFVGISTAPGVAGYVLTNTLGGVYAFGAALFQGGMEGTPLNAPVNSISFIAAGGYWLSAADGGVFAFGAAQFFGSVPAGGTASSNSLSWLTLGAPVTLNKVSPDGTIETLWEGVIADWEDSIASGSVGLSVQCVGCLFQLDWYVAKPIPNLPFQGYSAETGNPIFGWDIAQAIPTAINSVSCPSPGTAIGLGAIPTPRLTPFNGNFCILNLPGGGDVTGILTVTQPAWDKMLTSYIQNILSQAESFGGSQFTVGLQRPRTPVLQVKDLETINWTISTGGRGIAHDLSLDITTAANVIYGSGTAPPIISTIQAGSAVTTTGLAGCFPAGTSVRAAGIEKAYRRWHSGEMVYVTTAAGHKLAATPNHPVLTPSGWCPISSLKEGDQVFQDASRRIGDLRVDHDVIDIPSPIEKVFNSLSCVGTTERLAASSIDFHGDIAYSEVDVVRPYGQLGNGDDLGCDAEGACDALGSLIAEVAPDYVIDIQIKPWQGEVFNFQTESGGYVAEGLIVHNSWAGAKFPRVPPSDPAIFPLGSGESFSPGDGQTGFQPFSDWMRQSGWPMVSQDTYVATNPSLGNLDYYLVLNWQVQAGLEPTGMVDVDTWFDAFAAGTNDTAISNVYYSPLWELPEVEPYIYTPSGAFAGLNPFYNSAVPRVERYEAMGSQVSKAQGILSANIEGLSIQVPSWTGTITLTADPQEGSRFEILAGQNIVLQYFHGRSVVFHISNVAVDFTTLSVQLTVSAQALDLITLAAIYARDSQAHGVSRQARPSLVNLNISSNTTTFDSESSAGLVPPLFCPAGQWTVYKMGASQSGSIAETTLTSSPATPFAVGVFSGPVTAADLLAIFGSAGPLVADVDGNNPWNDFAVQLDNRGLLYGAGGPSGACGFYPSDPNGTQTLTGQYVDGQTWPYCSAPGYSPWLWVALWSTAESFITGRFLPAPNSAT